MSYKKQKSNIDIDSILSKTRRLLERKTLFPESSLFKKLPKNGEKTLNIQQKSTKSSFYDVQTSIYPKGNSSDGSKENKSFETEDFSFVKPSSPERRRYSEGSYQISNSPRLSSVLRSNFERKGAESDYICLKTPSKSVLDKNQVKIVEIRYGNGTDDRKIYNSPEGGFWPPNEGIKTKVVPFYSTQNVEKALPKTKVCVRFGEPVKISQEVLSDFSSPCFTEDDQICSLERESSIRNSEINNSPLFSDHNEYFVSDSSEILDSNRKVEHELKKKLPGKVPKGKFVSCDVLNHFNEVDEEGTYSYENDDAEETENESEILLSAHNDANDNDSDVQSEILLSAHNDANDNDSDVQSEMLLSAQNDDEKTDEECLSTMVLNCEYVQETYEEEEEIASKRIGDEDEKNRIRITEKFLNQDNSVKFRKYDTENTL